MQNATAREKTNENRTHNQEISISEEELTDEKDKLNGIESSLTSQSENISNKYQSAKDNIQQQLKNSEETYNERKQAWITANMQSVDLPARLEALGDISYFSFNPVDENFFGNTIWWASFVITLLFISLETAPVVVKLLTKRGSYDEMRGRLEVLF